MKTPSLLVAVLALLVVTGSSAFEILECDGFDSPGDAAPIKGWNLVFGPLGVISVDNTGATTSGLSPAAVNAVWAQAAADWQAVPNLSPAFSFGPLVPVNFTPFQLGNTFLNSNGLPAAAPDGSDGVRNWRVLNHHSQMVKEGKVLTGWSAITGTDIGAVLGVCFVQLNLLDNTIKDGEIFINDDVGDIAAPGPGGTWSAVLPPAVPGGAQFSLYSVALHEIGHFLGIAHTLDTAAIMKPAIAPGVQDGLLPDDERAIQFLYPSPAVAGSLPLPDRYNFAGPLCAPGAPTNAAATFGRAPDGCDFSPRGPSHVLPALVLLLLAAVRLAARDPHI